MNNKDTRLSPSYTVFLGQNDQVNILSTKRNLKESAFHSGCTPPKPDEKRSVQNITKSIASATNLALQLLRQDWSENTVPKVNVSVCNENHTRPFTVFNPAVTSDTGDEAKSVESTF